MNAVSAAAEGGPCSHWAASRGRKNQLTLPFLNAHVPSEGALLGGSFRPTQGDGKGVLEGLRLGAKLQFLSSGVHGRAYLVEDASPSFHKRLFGRLHSYIMGSPHGASKKVIVKVTALDRPFEVDSVRMESKLQSWVHDQVVIYNGLRISGSTLAPQVFYGGLLDADSGMVFITVMDMAPGKSLGHLLKGKKGLTAHQFAAIEKATASLWLLGVSHADLHQENLFFDPATNKVTIIDFGYGLILPGQVKKKIDRFNFTGAASNKVWYDKKVGLSKYVNAIQQGRG